MLAYDWKQTMRAQYLAVKMCERSDCKKAKEYRGEVWVLTRVMKKTSHFSKRTFYSPARLCILSYLLCLLFR